ncbi:MAG TPA: transposase [Opitutaceae bacterium]|nr:transposase [Opitutaceae bacterium]
MHRPHLRRLGRVWIEDPVYFITTNVHNRLPVLAADSTAAVLLDEWHHAKRRHGWLIGRYVIMPDHVHFFTRAAGEERSLEAMMNKWKEWTAKRLLSLRGGVAPFWQKRFFDHVLRSPASYEERWEYIRMNPVRAKLVARPEDWSYQGFVDFDGLI